MKTNPSEWSNRDLLSCYQELIDFQQTGLLADDSIIRKVSDRQDVLSLNMTGYELSMQLLANILEVASEVKHRMPNYSDTPEDVLRLEGKQSLIYDLDI